MRIVEECRDVPDAIMEHLLPCRSTRSEVRTLHDEHLKSVVRDSSDRTVVLVFVGQHAAIQTHTRIVKLRWWMPEVGECGWRVCERQYISTSATLPSRRGGGSSSTTVVY